MKKILNLWYDKYGKSNSDFIKNDCQYKYLIIWRFF